MMYNVPKGKRLTDIPKLYDTENIQLRDKIIHLHFFIGGCDWYIAEFNGKDIMWGYCILNGDYQNSEWGYISFDELKSIKISGVQVDCEFKKYFPPQKASKVKEIARGNGY